MHTLHIVTYSYAALEETEMSGGRALAVLWGELNILLIVLAMVGITPTSLSLEEGVRMALSCRIHGYWTCSQGGGRKEGATVTIIDCNEYIANSQDAL